jgi:HEAT repeat protein
MPLFGKPNVEKLKGRHDIAGLAQALGDKDENVARGAAQALATLGDPAALEPLIDAVRAGERLNWSDRPPSYEAARGVSRDVRDPRCLDRILGLLTEGEGAVRAWAKEALWAIGEPAVEPLIALLRDQRVAPWAALALGGVGDPRALDPLAAAFEQGDAETRRVVAKVLPEFGEEGQRALLALAGSQDSGAREALIPVLEEIGEDGAADALVAYLDDQSDDVRRAAASALAKKGHQAAVEPLLADLGGDDPEVRVGALVVLQSLAWPKAKEVLEPKVKEVIDGWEPPTITRSNRCDICNGEVEASGKAIPYMDFYRSVLQGYNPFATSRLSATETSDVLMRGAIDVAKRSELEDPMVGVLMAQSILARQGGAYEAWKSRVRQDEDHLGMGWTVCEACAEDVATFVVIGGAEREE